MTYVIIDVIPTSLGVIYVKHSSLSGAILIAYDASTTTFEQIDDNNANNNINDNDNDNDVAVRVRVVVVDIMLKLFVASIILCILT